ncbi:unnamed protein product [Rhizophagus irregularis]|uniref:Uncharacterized protein n=1 Tax=Rhizophagus irregularis TaxID=588596 RepID=A0A915ZM21_9GLOM|nr:unnamed protein product [Rhizophagus irregularis]
MARHKFTTLLTPTAPVTPTTPTPGSNDTIHPKHAGGCPPNPVWDQKYNKYDFDNIDNIRYGPPTLNNFIINLFKNRRLEFRNRTTSFCRTLFGKV